MKTLFKRLVPVCLVATAAITINTTGAVAGGNGSLFSSDVGALSGLQTPLATARSQPLLYTDVEPVKVENPAAQENHDEAEVAELFQAYAQGRFTEQDLNCLAEAVYHEARGESRQGQAAVAEVILNRVESRSFPSTVCGVINQPAQFSYTIGGRKPINNKAAYLRARDVAKAALSGAPRVLTDGATYFHTPSVRPDWSSRFTRTVQIGQHIFYRRGGQRVASN
ncbi:cell wall hydrolase [Paracoccus caeni]|uniref:Cell wall hydrolase n=1 Tax=Paracoccus caeni TaxID=657651 RepID=A0A934SGY9_9RHOB|nr:cell wall hydrolase [Paracoccus caeni]MBK4215212.1 cell wall hydrolase [Paracoccus caeni]